MAELNDGMVSWAGVDECGCPNELRSRGLHMSRCEWLRDTPLLYPDPGDYRACATCKRALDSSWPHDDCPSCREYEREPR